MKKKILFLSLLAISPFAASAMEQQENTDALLFMEFTNHAEQLLANQQPTRVAALEIQKIALDANIKKFRLEAEAAEKENNFASLAHAKMFYFAARLKYLDGNYLAALASLQLIFMHPEYSQIEQNVEPLMGKIFAGMIEKDREDGIKWLCITCENKFVTQRLNNLARNLLAEELVHWRS